MRRLSKPVSALAISTAILAAAPKIVSAYPIDCAIFLCMAGGFPSSAECAAAKAEVIRRISPYPVEPPLQLWRCPMRVDAATAARIGLTQDAGPDGLPEEVRRYRDGIEIYHIQAYARLRTRDGEDRVIDATQVGRYLPSGDFTWAHSSYEKGPAWLAEAIGGERINVTECMSRGRGGICQSERIVGQENRADQGLTRHASFRGVAFRYTDHKGTQHMEFIRY